MSRRVRGSGFDTYGSFSTAETSGLLARDADDSKAASPNERSRQLSSEPASFQTSRFFSSNLYGTLPSASVPLFERLVFRISRGNAILRMWPIDEQLQDSAVDGALVSKSVFFVTYVGEEMEKKLRKAIAVVGANEYDIPASTEQRERMSRSLRQQKAEVQRVIARTEDELHEQLSALAFDEQSGVSPYWNWQVALQKERGICDTLRRCEQTEHSRMLVCEGWLETSHLTQLQATLALAVAQSKLQQAVLQVLPTLDSQQPPTHFPTNKFTAAFQIIVDTYGVPRYKEVNPGLFTIISFPFLFGVMYGDVGHGTLLTLGACYLLYSERRMLEQQRRGQMNEIVAMVFGGRYLLLLMGLFAVYCGLIYNDCFSIPLPLFPSTYSFAHHKRGDVEVHKRGVYPFGVDWQWYHTSNELAFFNSLKMKTSVVLGVTQMLFGILLSAANDVYFHDVAAVWLEFLPRLLFMLCTFGYMCFLILYKWTVDFSADDAPPAANLIQTMIAMFLSPGHVDADKQLYSGQAGVQAVLLGVALLSVPFMLMGVPLVERREHARKAKLEENLRAADGDELEEAEEGRQRLSGNGAGGDEEERERRQARTRPAVGSVKKRTRRRGGYETVGLDDDEKDGEHSEEEKELASAHSHVGLYQGAAFISGGPSTAIEGSSAPTLPHSHTASTSSVSAYSFSDSLITQSIHTIEFVLGCVSNTASYLRLWALSLAHAQLAAVFWQKMLQQYGVETGSVLLTVGGVAVWSGATFAVLLCMDVLECFLHALRLHWVEFQNKFYHADGIPFEPFTFQSAEAGAGGGKSD